MFRVKSKLRNKIFFMMALVSVVPVFAAGFLSVNSIRASHKIDVANLEDALLDQKAGEIKKFFLDVQTALQTKVISNRPGAIDETRSLILKSAWETNQALGIQEITFVGLDGKELAKLNSAHPDGVAVSELRDNGSAAWLRDVKAGKVVFGDEVNFVSGAPTITIAAASVNQDNSPAYILVASFALGKIQEELQGARLGNTGYLYLLDRHGKAIASSLNGPAIAADLSATGIAADVIRGKDFSGPDGQMIYKSSFGEEVVAAGKSIPAFNWGLVAEWPTREADATVDSLIYKNLVTLILVFLTIVVVSVLLSNFIVRPVRALERSSELVAEGKFDVEVKIKTGDELEELGLAFNKMTAGLKRLEELKNEFVFIAAHELRTPVGAMKGYLTLILDGLTGPITDKTKDFIQKVVKSNERLIQLVNDLLEVSRSEGGKLAIKVAPIDVVEPIKSVLVELQSLADKASVQMAYEPFDPAPSTTLGTGQGKPLPKVLADADRLKEVMVNLIGNSIKYMGPPKGEAGASGKVTVSHEVQGTNMITHVVDTGLGMPKEAQAKLFEKFYRVASEKTRDIQGTGLGLFIVKEIIEKMGGTIAVNSEEGKGSDFYFSLPIA